MDLAIPRFFVLRLRQLLAVHTALSLRFRSQALAETALVVQAFEFAPLVIGLATAFAVPSDGSIQLALLVVNAFLAIAVTIACAGHASCATHHKQR
jgi:hypothetical protein